MREAGPCSGIYGQARVRFCGSLRVHGSARLPAQQLIRARSWPRDEAASPSYLRSEGLRKSQIKTGVRAVPAGSSHSLQVNAFLKPLS